jgi:hypothetical protein
MGGVCREVDSQRDASDRARKYYAASDGHGWRLATSPSPLAPLAASSALPSGPDSAIHRGTCGRGH